MKRLILVISLIYATACCSFADDYSHLKCQIEGLKGKTLTSMEELKWQFVIVDAYENTKIISSYGLHSLLRKLYKRTELTEPLDMCIDYDEIARWVDEIVSNSNELTLKEELSLIKGRLDLIEYKLLNDK